MPISEWRTATLFVFTHPSIVATELHFVPLLPRINRASGKIVAQKRRSYYINRCSAVHVRWYRHAVSRNGKSFKSFRYSNRGEPRDRARKLEHRSNGTNSLPLPCFLRNVASLTLGFPSGNRQF